MDGQHRKEVEEERWSQLHHEQKLKLPQDSRQQLMGEEEGRKMKLRPEQ